MSKRFIIPAILCCTSFLVLISSAGPCDLPQYCTPSQVIGCVQSIRYNNSYYEEAIDDIVKSIEPYVYLDILKNPPQIEDFTDHFKPVDLVSELKAIKAKRFANYYDFYRTIQEILMRAQDGHFAFKFIGNKEFDNKLTTFYFILPLALYTEVNAKGEAVMKSVPLTGASYLYDHFENGAEIKALINKNYNVPIISINGESPFDFVIGLGGKYYNYLKNKDAKYTYASNMLKYTLPIYYAPLSEEEFSNLTVVYESGDKFKTNFYFTNIAASQVYEGKDINDDIVDFAREKIRNSPFSKPVGLEEIIRSYNSGERNKETKTDKKILETFKNNCPIKINNIKENAKTTTEGAWNFVTSDGILKCRVDDINEVNVYVVTSFGPKNTTEFLEVLGNCAGLFDSNLYPLIVVDDNNGGGNIILSNVFQEILQFNSVSRTYFSYKTDDATRRVLNTLTNNVIISDPNTCKRFVSSEGIMEDPVIDYYGSGVTHTRSKPVLLGYVSVRELMDLTKLSITTKRKPTEIVVFTDSYSFSAGSLFTKGMKEAGAAIMTGYNGYPGSSKETFDIGQSPTQSMSDGYLRLFNPNEYYRLLQKGITYSSMSFGETFRVEDIDSKKASPIPREFLVDVPDERIPFYNSYNDNVYGWFVKYGKEILTKYETYCNPDNPKLHMRNEECDAVINKAHMHGGYTCGADGKWSTTCEGYYCDDGYYFDTYTKECVVDPCYTLPKNV